MESRRKRRVEQNQEKNKQTKWVWICLGMFVLMIYVYYQVWGLLNYTMGKEVDEKQIAVYRWFVGKRDNQQSSEKQTEINIAILGNLKAKGNLIDSYMNEGIVDYSSVFKNISFEEYDYVIANLNTTIPLDSKPNNQFYANSRFIKELKNIKVDMLVTATKELAEENKEAFVETIDAIKKHDIKYVGAKKNKTDKSYQIVNKKGIKIAVLSYVSEDDAKNECVSVYSKKQIKKDIKEVQKEDIQAIIVFVDAFRTGEEIVTNDKQDMLKEILSLGADIVISSDTIVQSLYEEKETKKYIKYSLGDVIGLQEGENSDISSILKVTIRKTTKGDKNTASVDVKEDKTLVALSNANKTRYKVVDLQTEINRFDISSDRITVTEYNYLNKIKDNM